MNQQRLAAPKCSVWARLVSRAASSPSWHRKVEGVALIDTVAGTESILDVTGMFVAIGHQPRGELVRGRVDLDDRGYVPSRRRTP